MQERERTEIQINPAGPEQPGPIRQFHLERLITRESRRSDRERWQWEGSERTTLITLTRRELSELIGSAADWLSFINSEGN